MEPFRKAKAAQIEAQRQAEMAAKIREKIKEQKRQAKNVRLKMLKCLIWQKNTVRKKRK